MAKFTMPKLPKFPKPSAVLASISSSLKKVNWRGILPTSDQIKSPLGLTIVTTSIVAVGILVFGLSTLAPATNNGRQGNNQQGSDSSLDFSSSGSTDASAQRPSRKPVSGPMASELEADAAAQEADRQLRDEQARISNLSPKDKVLVMLKATMDSYIAIADLAADKGDAKTIETAKVLKSSAQKALAEVESIASARKLEWPKLGVELKQGDVQRLRSSFMLPASELPTFTNATGQDYVLAFENIVIRSVNGLVEFNASRDMPDEKEFKNLIKLISSGFGDLSKSYNK